MRHARTGFGLACALLIGGPVLAGDGPRYERRWFYAMTNLQVAENADRLVDLIERAGAAGYNGVVLADYKLNVLDRVPDHYFSNYERVAGAAERAGVEIIPAVFPIGYSAGLLAHDPDLAEGLPVVDAPFVVRDGEARLVADPAAVVRNGDFEAAGADRFAEFSYQDAPGTSTFADREVFHGGGRSLRIDAGRKAPDAPNARVIQRVPVRPFACYRLSAWVKTEGLAAPGSFNLLAMGASEGGRPLTFLEGGVAATQSWERVAVVFNSLENDAVNLYAGLWGVGGGGTLWIDDLALEELSLVKSSAARAAR